MEQTRRELAAGVKSTVDELLVANSPLDAEMLKGFVSNPESFFSPPALRATRGFIKGQIPRERIVKEFGDAALPLFNDMTTGKLNPNPKPEEVALAFKNEFKGTVVDAIGVAG